MLRQIEVPLVAAYAVQLDAVHRIALAAGEGRVLRDELVVERVGRLDGRIEQVPAAGGAKVRRGDLETVVAGGRRLRQGSNPRVHLGLERGVRVCHEREDRRLEHAAAE